MACNKDYKFYVILQIDVKSNMIIGISDYDEYLYIVEKFKKDEILTTKIAWIDSSYHRTNFIRLNKILNIYILNKIDLLEVKQENTKVLELIMDEKEVN